MDAVRKCERGTLRGRLVLDLGVPINGQCEGYGILGEADRSGSTMDRLSKADRSRVMSRVSSRNTAPERTVRSLIHKLGYRFRLHSKGLPGTPDIVFASRRKVIFVNGCFWHGHTCKRGKRPSSNVSFWRAKIAKNVLRDRRVRSLLTDQGWKTMTVWQCELSDSTLPTRLRAYLEIGAPDHK